jgi:DnaJ-domain-containing protein 1
MLKDAAAAKREYARKWKEQNRDKVNAYHKKWREKPENKKKIQEYNERYWTKKAQEMNARDSD